MKTQGIVVALTSINLVLLALAMARPASTAAPPASGVVRASAFELVDEHGEIRSRLDVEESGEVVLRLFDADGTIRVKLGAGKDGSGLVMLDEATEPAIHLVARRAGSSDRPATTSITLRGKAGEERVITP